MKHFGQVENILRTLWVLEVDLESRHNVPADVQDAERYRDVTQEDLDRIANLLGRLTGDLAFMEWHSVLDRASQIYAKLRITTGIDELYIEIKGICQTVQQELRRRWFLYLPENKALRQRGAESDWGMVRRAFPATDVEIKAALACYATENNTAALFHTMRVAELGLRAIAKERKVTIAKNRPLEWGTWQEIITELEKESRQIAQTKKAGAAKDRAVAFYTGAVADLMAFKDEYRNQVSHVRTIYDEHQALRAIGKVHEFMTRISGKIDHRHHRIRWGLKP